MSTESARPLDRRLRRLAIGLTAVALLALAACGPAPDDGETDPTVDVEPVADVPEVEDPKEIPRGQGLSGILPGGFPEDLPLYLPASLVDFGETEDGTPWVDLLTPRSRDTVRKGLLGLVRDAGWQVEPGEEALLLAKDGRLVRVTIRDGKPGTIYRVEY